MKIRYWIWLLFLLGYWPALAQKVELKLLPMAKPLIGADFLIQSVYISSQVKESLGQVYFRKNETAPVYLQDALQKTILNFYRESTYRPSENPKEIAVEVLGLSVSEKWSPALQIYEGDFRMVIRFNLLGKSSPVRLVDFKKEARFQRSLNSVNRLEALVNQYFRESLEFFDQWIQEQEKSNPQLAKSVQIKFLDVPRPSTEDTVFYDPDRPLQWSDFRDRPNPSSKFNAVIANSFGIQGHAELVEGSIVQTLEIKVFMLPRQSWARDKEEYGINHERRHFDLTRIVVNQFKKSLESQELDPEFFQGQIQDEFFEYYRKLNRIQQLYDDQTAHGLNKEAQGTWNLWIKDGLFGDWEAIEEALAAKDN